MPLSCYEFRGTFLVLNFSLLFILPFGHKRVVIPEMEISALAAMPDFMFARQEQSLINFYMIHSPFVILPCLFRPTRMALEMRLCSSKPVSSIISGIYIYIGKKPSGGGIERIESSRFRHFQRSASLHVGSCLKTAGGIHSEEG